MKVKLEATIPTTQYGNLRPTFELEDDGDTEKALSELSNLWKRFGESPLKEKTVSSEVKAVESTAVKITTYTGEEVLWDEGNHRYTDMDGNVLLSGSKYADQNSPKFDLKMMLPKVSKAWGVDQEQLGKLWKMNSNVALNWGSSVHYALEIAHTFGTMGQEIAEKKEMDANYTLPKQPYLRKVVLDFIEKFGVGAIAEPIITDVKSGMAGTIDRLEITGDKKCRIGDYKTNAEMDKKKMKRYQLQLSFYAQIMINHGWEVEGLDLFHYTEEDGWTKHELELLEVEV